MVTRCIKRLAARYDLWGDEPLHGLGEIGSREFQFRASGREWELHIAGYHGLPSDGDRTGYTYRGKFSSPKIDDAEAAAIVEECLRKHTEMAD